MNCDINIQQVHSKNNLAGLFTKALHAAIFIKLVHNIGVCRLKDLDKYCYEGELIRDVLFTLTMVFSIGVSCKDFNETSIIAYNKNHELLFLH